MKVFYFNDEQKPVIVKVMDDTWDYTGKDDNKKNFHTLNAADHKVFDLVVPDGAILYIKKWPGIVMLSYILSRNLPPEDDMFPRSGAI
jgi:hypothetical protein